MKNNTLDIQGHRGCRGLYPENTIPAFVHAMDLGVNTLEFDVVISKDNQVIISHDPYMSHHIATGPNALEITEKTEKDHNIYKLTYAEIQTYDVGLKDFPRFPEQKKIPVHKPALKDLIAVTEAKNNKILYNIEIKRRPENDEIFHPHYKTFADLVVNEITDLGIMDRTTVQCFDVATLIYINERYPNVRLVYLIENEDSPTDNLAKIGFTPYVYSPDYKLVDKELVKLCQEKNMQLIPWTVNEVEDMKAMIDLGVKGIISDYPDRLIGLVAR
ncbi:glycerophosphodiester phosphodiesterase family protein [Saprospiraceae bacterium]|nr:glycerophosphodiester phosphodiesterase family protein [Saprospiraceae bacterium]